MRFNKNAYNAHTCFSSLQGREAKSFCSYTAGWRLTHIIINRKERESAIFPVGMFFRLKRRRMRVVTFRHLMLCFDIIFFFKTNEAFAFPCGHERHHVVCRKFYRPSTSGNLTFAFIFRCIAYAECSTGTRLYPPTWPYVGPKQSPQIYQKLVWREAENSASK